MKAKLFLIGLLCCVLSGINFKANAQEEVNNAQILEYLEMGLDAETIMNFVDNATIRNIDLRDLNFLSKLKEAGAMDLIKGLQKVVKVDTKKQGLYWIPNNGQPKEVLRNTFEKESGGFNGKALGTAVGIGGAIIGIGSGSKVGTAASVTGGILVASTEKEFNKLVLQGAHAKVVLTGEDASNPTFRFYFPRKEEGEQFTTQNNAYMAMMTEVQSPNEFQCIKLKVNEKKKKRTFPDGSKYSVAGFTSSGSGAKNIVDFEINAINNYTFDVTFPDGLEPGEYVFFYKNGLGNENFQAQPFGFDFSVQ